MHNSTRIFKITILFFGIITLGFLVFIFTVGYIVASPRKLPTFISVKKDNALRGEIISKDGYILASSKKIYYAAVNTNSINSQKKSLFIKLFSIYSGIDEKTVKERINSKNGYVVLSDNIDSKTAKHLKTLNYKLSSLKVFDAYQSKELGKTIFLGLDVLEKGEERFFTHNDTFEPFIGYIRNSLENEKYYINGVKGIESTYNKYLNYNQDGYIKGKRDRPSHILINNDTIIKERIDGINAHLNINLTLQKNIEQILDRYKASLEAQEIVCGVMESSTGKLVSVASSNRFNPNFITKDDIPYLNSTVSEYPFEPGSVMKPIVFSILLKKNLVTPVELIRGYNGKYKIGRMTITDTHKADWLSGEDVIIHSSNIGMAQLAQRLSSIEIYSGLKKFGFTEKTDIDLPYEQVGDIVTLKQLENEVYKATVSYGYGIRATFLQILQAYSVFNNNGISKSPKITSSLEYYNDKKRDIFSHSKQVIDSTTATKINKILRKVVKKGTGVGADIDGLYIGGKTGTAHIATNGKYTKEYISSFFGFANDIKNKYTIGVTVIKPNNSYNEYFAAQTAVPIFREIVEAMVNKKLLQKSIEDDKTNN